MMTDVVEQSSGVARSRSSDEHEGGARPAGDGGTEPTAETVGGARTGTEDSAAGARIVAIRERIDEIDRTLIELWHERATLSQEVGVTRMASGGTRLVLSRERDILERFREALGADGTQLALLLLRAGRGPL
ncbi:chorismate mutase [Micromonospora sp. RTGN7]|uniref:chorismate mutase n=1 Tax=Micromonospora sp. RTGN7 TaxID=3016526 RepID=UPI0029FF1FBE|nr:chorismate mutase [Micromonospora sp. RTGN7]